MKIKSSLIVVPYGLAAPLAFAYLAHATDRSLDQKYSQNSNIVTYYYNLK